MGPVQGRVLKAILKVAKRTQNNVTEPPIYELTKFLLFLACVSPHWNNLGVGPIGEFLWLHT